MTKMTLLIVTTLLVTIPIIAAQATAPKKPGEEESGLSVLLKLSVEEFDPSKPKGTIACWVTNRSDKDIVLPAGHRGDAVVLNAGRLRLWRQDKPMKDGKERVVVIKPGKEELVFELVLAEILGSPKGNNRDWRWNWDRRPEPPLSPIHKWREPGYEESAAFYVTVEAGNAKTDSNRVTLKVRDSGGTSK